MGVPLHGTFLVDLLPVPLRPLQQLLWPFPWCLLASGSGRGGARCDGSAERVAGTKRGERLVPTTCGLQKTIKNQQKPLFLVPKNQVSRDKNPGFSMVFGATGRKYMKQIKLWRLHHLVGLNI